MHNIFVVLICISSTALINFSYIYLTLIVLHCSSFSSKCCAHFYWTLGLLIIELHELYTYSGCKSFAGYIVDVVSVSGLPFHYSLNFSYKSFHMKNVRPDIFTTNRINNVYSSKIYENKGNKGWRKGKGRTIL